MTKIQVLPASERAVSTKIVTSRNKIVDPYDMKVVDVSIDDIGHALSNICRFTGHVSEFYSVAQHSVLVSILVQDKQTRLGYYDAFGILWGLLHDAGEAYIQDIAKPVKSAMEGIEEVEADILEAVRIALDLPPYTDLQWQDVKGADDLALQMEQWRLMPSNSWTHVSEEAKRLSMTYRQYLNPQSPVTARGEFWDRFYGLTDII